MSVMAAQNRTSSHTQH